MNQPAIIHEDNHIIVAIKPQNMPTQADASGDPDLESQLREYRRVNENKAGPAYLATVHRLDRVTGGVMVFAKTTKAAARLSEQIREGGFSKKYLTITEGIPKERHATLEHHLLKNENKNLVEIVPSLTTGAKRAVLDYQIVALGQSRALLAVTLVTGRTHQIRVQLSAIGCPIVGDTKYRAKTKGDLALWSHQLAFTHPTTGESLKFIVNPPEHDPWAAFEFNRKPHKKEKEGESLEA